MKIMFGDFCPFKRQWESVLFAHVIPRNGSRSHKKVATLASYNEKTFKQKLCDHETLFCALYCYDLPYKFIFYLLQVIYRILDTYKTIRSSEF